jgi:nicotinic acid mononucleotide adenylyltransferase
MNVSIHISQHEIQYLRRVQTLLDELNPQAPPQALLAPGSPVPRDGIIVFPGSFNPPTTAHLALLKEARQFARFQAFSQGKSEVIHLYAAMSRHIVDKEGVERPLMVDRIILLDTVLRHRFRHAGILLFNRGLYVEQAQAVRSSFPDVTRLLFLIGFDKIVQILDPHYYEDRDASLHALFSLAELLVAPRGGAGREALTELLDKPENKPFAPYIHPLPFSSTYRDVSSTHIRQNPSAYMHDIPQEVRHFIYTTRAYSPPLRLADGSEIDYYAEREKTLETLVKNARNVQGVYLSRFVQHPHF